MRVEDHYYSTRAETPNQISPFGLVSDALNQRIQCPDLFSQAHLPAPHHRQ
jgi:hypothetical protein